MPTRADVAVYCGSPFHTGNAAYSLDVQVGTGSNIYATKDGTVEDVGDAGVAPSYGRYIVIQTTVAIADQSRQYIHGYAHLSQQDVVEGTLVGAGAIIAKSGSTGTNPPAPHLHFHVSRLDGTRGPVDLSPMVGFTPNLLYPDQWGTCGQVAALIPDGGFPLIVESVGFTLRTSGSDHYWFCYQGGHTAECGMTTVENIGYLWDPTSLPSSDFSGTAYVDYDNVFVPKSTIYYIWLCGFGGAGDGTVHSATQDTMIEKTSRLNGYSTSWSWQSSSQTGLRPSRLLFSSIVGGGTLVDRTVNIIMREDGFLYDRVLLTEHSTYDPSGKIRCGGY